MKTTLGFACHRHSRTDAVQRETLLAEFARSGLSAAAFARRHGLNYTTFCGWRQRQDKSKPSPDFVRVELPPPTSAEPVLELGSRARVRITEAGQIALAAQLLRALNLPRPYQWPTLARCLEHGEVELDNNLVENAIRPTAIGKKNWLFFGSADAGQRSAVVYTLVANCRLHGVEPYSYLKDVLERLPRTPNQQVAQLTPLRWTDAQRCPVELAA